MMASIKKVFLNVKSLCRFAPILKTNFRPKHTQPRYVGIGFSETKNDTDDPYSPGQMFLNERFDYRGVVLFPCKCSIHVKQGEQEEASSEALEKFFYMSLVDSRDDPKTSMESGLIVPLKSMIPGMDVVPHEDVSPYRSSEDNPIHHRHIDTFFFKQLADSPQFLPSEDLLDWQKNHSWFQPRTAYTQTTHKISITVIPSFVCKYQSPMKNSSKYRWVWRYFIHIENQGDETVRLRDRKWYINNLGKDDLEIVSGRGVVGFEPELSPKKRCFYYSSYVELNSPNGQMWGSYNMERKDSSTFVCTIPCFDLKSESEQESTS